jgi:hypothetical protein
MTTRAEQKQAERQRHVDAGMVRWELWVTPREKPILKAFIDQIRKKAKK